MTPEGLNQALAAVVGALYRSAPLDRYEGTLREHLRPFIRDIVLERVERLGKDRACAQLGISRDVLRCVLEGKRYRLDMLEVER